MLGSPDSFIYEHRSDGGLWLTLKRGHLVNDFLQDLAKHVNLSQPPSSLVQDFCINQLILQLNGEGRENEPVSIHFSREELPGVEPHHGGITLRYADQKVLNSTFLELLPCNTL